MKNNETTTFWFRHWKQLVAILGMVIIIVIITVSDNTFLIVNLSSLQGLLVGYICFYDFGKDALKRKALRDNRRKLEENE